MTSQTLDRWNELTSIEFEKMADKYGTPFYLYDADEINHRIKFIRESMDNLVEVFYAVKANPNLGLLRAVRNMADGLDISSGGELEQAELAGFDMAQISFAGPAKTRNELTASIEKGVGCISIESMRELKECVDISRQINIKANVVMRVNPNLLNRAFGMKMGGKPIQFGIDEEEISDILEFIIANSQYLVFQGIHIYAGSQCFYPSGIVEGIENTFRIVREIETKTKLKCTTINLGGGFGVSHTENSKELDIKALAINLLPILRVFHNSSPIQRKIVFELGRFLTANAGIYVSRVISSKESRGKKFIMMDGGLHHHLAAAGTFGTALRSNFILKNISRPDAQKIECNVAGPSCNPTDLLGVKVELEQPEHGDLIAILKSGSYGFTASPLLFLGRQTPAELVLQNNEIILGRHPKKMADFN